MKTLLLLFFSTYILDNTVFANDEPLQKTSLLEEPSQKKGSFVLQKNKFLNKRYEKSTEPIRTKKSIVNSYTVFPNHQKTYKKVIDVPSSPYFPVENQDEPKLRVKKVLPDFWNESVRRKRSADENPSNLAKVEKAESSLKIPSPAADKKDTQKETDAQRDTTAKATTRPEHKKDKVEVDENLHLKRDVLEPIKEAKKINTKPVAVTKAAHKNVTQIVARKKGRSGSKKSHGTSKSSKQHHGSKEGSPAKKVKRSRSNKRSKKSSKKGGSKKRSHSRKMNAKDPKANAGRRLIAARDAIIENYPYAVSIQKDGEHWCTGALLNQRLVITTANCVWKSSRMSRLKIRAGSRNAKHGGQTAEIAEVMKHPKWSIRKNPDNDVALLLTDRNIKFSHTCHAVDLPNRIMMPVFEDAWIVSWGTERRDGIYDRPEMTLQVYHSRLMSRDKCNNVTMRFGVFVTENFICLEQTGRQAPCTRDTGAPAVSDGVLWGLASWGIRKMCGTERFPAMFSYIASDSNMDFIINATHYMMAEERLYPYLDRYQPAQVPILTSVNNKK